MLSTTLTKQTDHTVMHLIGRIDTLTSKTLESRGYESAERGGPV